MKIKVFYLGREIIRAEIEGKNLVGDPELAVLSGQSAKAIRNIAAAETEFQYEVQTWNGTMEVFEK
jgi:hypothetical protein